MKSAVIPVDLPSPAMMKENSPIWARLMPMRMDVRKSFPAMNEPREQAATLPKIMSAVMTRMGTQ